MGVVVHRWVAVEHRAKSAIFLDVTPVVQGQDKSYSRKQYRSKACILGVRIDCGDGGRQFYLIGFALGDAGDAKEDAFVRVRSADGSEKWLYDAFRSDAFRKELFATIQGGTSLCGNNAELLLSSSINVNSGRTAGTGLNSGEGTRAADVLSSGLKPPFKL